MFRFTELLIVAEYEQALIYTQGRYARTVGPGLHRLWRLLKRQSATRFDMRKQLLSLAGQEVLTKNHVPVRVTLAIDFQVTDAVAAAHNVVCWQSQLYADAQLALRDVLAGLTFDDMLDSKNSLGRQVRELAAAQAVQYGIDLQRAAIKDITMPASIRDMMLKTVEAEKSSQASLIKAREEVAAARARANAARMMADNPAVLRLKELETLTELARSPGSTIVFAGSTDMRGLLAAAANKQD